MAGACATAPETQWHIEGKDAIAGCLHNYGIPYQLEKQGATGRQKWVADVYAEIGQRRVVIELQRSYQHYRDYLRRQRRYRVAGLEAYWLTRPELSLSLHKNINRERARESDAGPG
jgi:competence CoiA-like predicted nuclease